MKELTLAEECAALLNKRAMAHYRCPKCHRALQSIGMGARREPHFRCYTCCEDYVMRQWKWISVGKVEVHRRGA